MKRILTITGASGAGKDSIVDAILVSYGLKSPNEVNNIACTCKPYYADAKLPIRELVSYTTRAPRVGEMDGIDYYYIDMHTFEGIEKVEETEYAGNHYCLAANELRRIHDGGLGIVIVDQHGVECIDKFVKEHSDEFIRLSVFLKVTPAISKARMITRGDKTESIEKRLVQQLERSEYSPINPDLYNLILEANTGTDFTNNLNSVLDLIKF